MPTRTVGFIFPATGQNGPNNPDSAAGGGSANNNWVNPGNITATANTASFAVSGTTSTTNEWTIKYLQSRSYDLSTLPGNKPILGIEVRFEYTVTIPLAEATERGILDRCSILRADALDGTGKDPGVDVQNGVSGITENDTITLGGAADLWGLGSLNSDGLKSDSGFGFGVAGRIRVIGSSSENYDTTIEIHSHEMKIYYDAGGQVKVWTGSSFDLKDVKYYNGSAFVDTSEVKRYNGSSFEIVD